MLSKLKSFVERVDPTLPGPLMQEGEQIIRHGVGAKSKGMLGARWGPLLLTNRRLIWYENHSAWPLKTLAGEVRLPEIEAVDKGNFFNFIVGGQCIRIKLSSGKRELIYEGDGQLDEWINAVRLAAERGKPR